MLLWAKVDSSDVQIVKRIVLKHIFMLQQTILLGAANVTKKNHFQSLMLTVAPSAAFNIMCQRLVQRTMYFLMD